MQIGTKVKNKIAFPHVPLGTDGFVVMDYGGGYTVAWDTPNRPFPQELSFTEVAKMPISNVKCPIKNIFNKETELHLLEIMSYDPKVIRGYACIYTGMSLEVITSESRKRGVVDARALYATFCDKHRDNLTLHRGRPHSITTLSNLINKHHTTFLYLKDLAKRDDFFKRLYPKFETFVKYYMSKGQLPCESKYQTQPEQLEENFKNVSL